MQSILSLINCIAICTSCVYVKLILYYHLAINHVIGRGHCLARVGKNLREQCDSRPPPFHSSWPSLRRRGGHVLTTVCVTASQQRNLQRQFWTRKLQRSGAAATLPCAVAIFVPDSEGKKKKKYKNIKFSKSLAPNYTVIT